MQAVGNMRYRDDAVAFDSYGAVRDLVRRDDAGSRTARHPGLAGAARSRHRAPAGRAACARQRRVEEAPAGYRSRRGGHRSRPCAPSCRPGDCCEWRSSLGSVLRWPFGERADSDAVRLGGIRGSQRRPDHLRPVLHRSAVHRRLFLHALRQPPEVFAHRGQACTRATAARRAWHRRPGANGGHYLRSRVRPAVAAARLRTWTAAC